MTLNLPAHGATLWDTPVNAAFNTLASTGFAPNEHGWLNWTYCPSLAQNTDGLISGTVRMIKLPNLPLAYTITSIKYFVGVAATTPTAGQCFAGIYDSSGNRLAVTADISASLSTTGLKTFTLTAPLAVSVNQPIWGAILVNAAVAPSGATAVVQAGREPLINGDLTIAQSLYTSGPAAQTSLPASIAMGARTQIPRSPWLAVA